LTAHIIPEHEKGGLNVKKYNPVLSTFSYQTAITDDEPVDFLLPLIAVAAGVMVSSVSIGIRDR
jgi:hypothetical protein